MNQTDRDKLRVLLDEVNAMMETTLLLTRGDVRHVTEVLKSIETQSPCQSTISEIIVQLQSFDVFEQRLQHIIIVNDGVPLRTDPVAVDPQNIAKSIFRLNQLQYQDAWNDYHEAIHAARTLLKKLASLTDDNRIDAIELVTTGTLARAATHLVEDKFEKMVKLTAGWMPGSIVNYVTALQRVYSTEKERMVLSLFESNPALTTKDFTLRKQDDRSSTIDLF